MHWLPLAIITTIFLGLYHFFIKLSSGHINQVLGALILQIVAMVVGLVFLIVLKYIGATFAMTNKGLTYALLAGVSIGLAEVLTFYLFSKGVPASVGIAILIGGTVVVGAFLGIVFLRESLSIMQYIAIILIILGVSLLAEKAI